jgi:hypothetical protein
MGVADTYRDHLCTHTQVVLLALFPAFFLKVLDRANIVALMDIKRRFTEVQVRDLYHIHIQCTIRSAGQRDSRYIPYTMVYHIRCTIIMVVLVATYTRACPLKYKFFHSVCLRPDT